MFGIEIGSGTTGGWTITAHAICADPIPGLELRTLQSGPLSSNQGVVLSCSAGKQRARPRRRDDRAAFGQAVMDDLTPNADLTGVSIGAREVQGGTTSTTGRCKGYAICA